MLTIGQLAAFAGVTIRAVRHYHARGLLAEPDRDASGYRRYDAQAVVELIRIRTLAEAGVPLARVHALLQAEPDEFARAVTEIDRDLEDRIAVLQDHRRRVTELVTGDGLAVPPEVAVGYLSLLREIGLSDRAVGIERDGWLLLAARAPDRVAEWIKEKHEALADVPVPRALPPLRPGVGLVARRPAPRRPRRGPRPVPPPDHRRGRCGTRRPKPCSTTSSACWTLRSCGRRRPGSGSACWSTAAAYGAGPMSAPTTRGPA